MGQQENPWLGEKIDGYHIRHHVIGEGGMGAVYRAHHEEMGRTAAAKFLPLPCSDEMAKRFVREAQAHQRLENIPYVGRLHHFVTRHDGKPCYVLFLELFDKPAITLDEYVFIHSDRLTHPDFQMRLGEMYMKIAFALGQAQQLKDKNGNTAAVIHRDLKPGNIMILNPQQRELEPRVIDWGLARIKPVAELTSSSAGMGTPAYMSPEQLHTPDDVDFRSDIYSLGLVIFKTRTGEHFCPDIEENDEGYVIAAKAARFMHDSGRVRERLRTLPLPERVCLEPMLQTNRNKRPDGWWEVVGLLRGMYQYHSLRKDGETYHHGAFEKVDSSDIESAVSVDSKAEEGTVKKSYRKKLVAIAASVLLLLCSGGVALYFAYYLDPLRPEMKVARVKAEAVDASVTKPVQPRFKTKVKIEKKKPPPDPFRRESEWCKKHHKKRDSFSSTPTLHAWCVRNRAVKLRRKGVKEDDPEKIKEALEIIKKVRKKFCTWRNLRYDKNIRPYCKEKFWDDIRRSRKMLKKKKRDLSLP